MKTAFSIVIVGTTFFCAGAVGCGGDDTSSGGTAGAGGAATSATTSAGGSGGSSTGAGTGGSTGGSTTSTGGSGGSGSNGCPATMPMASTPCNIDHSCTYGPSTCDCVDSSWTCTGSGIDGGGGGMCPTDTPGPGDPCTTDGQTCVYDSGHTECTCSTADGWSCTAHARN